MRSLALTTTQQRRLEKLARDAGRTPQAMLRFVLRDGFEFCKWEVKEILAAEADVKQHGTVPHEEVRRQARAIIAAARKQHALADVGDARRRRKAA